MKENERLKSECISCVFFHNKPPSNLVACKQFIVTSDSVDGVGVLLLVLPALCHADSSGRGSAGVAGPLCMCGLSPTRKPDQAFSDHDDLRVLRG